MKLHRPVYILLILYMSFLTLSAQPNELGQPGDLTKDIAFFEKQKELYQKWLEHTGLAPTLSVEAIDVSKDRLSLYLKLPYQEVDSIIAAWDVVKSTFEKTHAITLEQQLFYKLVQLMEVRQGRVDVQVYDTYDLRKEPLFFRGIYFDADSGKVLVSTSDPKSEIRKIVFAPVNLRGMKKPSIEQLRQRMSRQVVFDKILSYAKNRYEYTPCEDRNPQLSVLETGEVLRFEVQDLCREVLTDAANPLLCQMLNPLGLDCNWVKRELLNFIITYELLQNGVQLTIEIDGKFGSGFYGRIERGGYIAMDQEPDLYEYLERYADIFSEAIKAELTR